MKCSAGCMVVSTNVGGVSEVLPSELCCFVEPSVDAVTRAVADCVEECKKKRVVRPRPRTKEVEQILEVYNWKAVGQRLGRVYDDVMIRPRKTLLQQLKGFWSQGLGSFLLLSIEYLLLVALNVLIQLGVCLSIPLFVVLDDCLVGTTVPRYGQPRTAKETSNRQLSGFSFSSIL